jgi:HTH-type transcriptional regulator/antitoxin HigA
MMERKVAEVFPPGEFIRDELEERGWTQNDLAEIMGRPIQAISEIVSGKKAITPETAQGLAGAFGTTPELWLNLENAYRLSLTKTDSAQVARKARLYSLAPVHDLVERGWIQGSSNVSILETEIIQFFGLQTIDDEPSRRFAARKSTAYDSMTPPQLAWCYRARQLSAAVHAIPFNRQRFAEGLPELRQMSRDESSLRRLPAFLADVGVRLVVVEHLPKTKIDGVAFWLSEEEKDPVVAVSLRYGRIDHFWFTLMHELAHIYHGDVSGVDCNLVGKDAERFDKKPESERRADKWAANLLVPEDRLQTFVRRCKGRFSKLKIRSFANEIGVHPGIVVGRLQHGDCISYAHSRDMLVDIRRIIVDVASTDGWERLRAI